MSATVTTGAVLLGLSSLRGNTSRYGAGGPSVTMVGAVRYVRATRSTILRGDRLDRPGVPVREVGPDPERLEEGVVPGQARIGATVERELAEQVRLGAGELGGAHRIEPDALELTQHRGLGPGLIGRRGAELHIEDAGPQPRGIGAARRVREALLVAHLGEEAARHASTQGGGQHLHRRVVGVRGGRGEKGHQHLGLRGRPHQHGAVGPRASRPAARARAHPRPSARRRTGARSRPRPPARSRPH